MKSNVLIVIVVALSLLSCKSNDDDMGVAICVAIEIDSDLFDTGTTDEHEVLSAVIENNCLVLNVRYGGGGGEVFGALVTPEEVIGNGEERNLRFLFDDQSPRDALLSQEFSFDLIPLRDPNNNIVNLLLSDFPNNPIVYEY